MTDNSITDRMGCLINCQRCHSISTVILCMQYFSNQFRNTNYQAPEDINKFASNEFNWLEWIFVPKHFRMADKIKAYYHTYAVSIFGWKCIICNFEAQDQIGLENSWFANEKVVYTDQLDQSKWFFL